MKRVRLIAVVALLCILGTTALAYAQQEQQSKRQGKEQGKSQEAKKQHQQPAPQHQQQAKKQHQQPAQRQHQSRKTVQRQNRPRQTYGGAYHGGLRSDGPAYGGVHESGVPQHQKQVRAGFGQSRANSWDDDHRTWGQRGGYNGYRVPENRFRLYFGREHYFRMYSLPMVFVGGYPRFQYDGYWVTFVDPWPETWASTWYENDDVYLDYTDDGYYVYNRAHPGLGIAVTIGF